MIGSLLWKPRLGPRRLLENIRLDLKNRYRMLLGKFQPKIIFEYHRGDHQLFRFTQFND